MAMKTMRWLLLGVALLALVPLAADPGNSLQPRATLTVYDARGKTVGAVIDTNFSIGGAASGLPTVAYKAGQQTIVVGVKPDHFVGSADMWFATADCSGTPYFLFPGNVGPSLIPRSFVTNDGELYAATVGSSPSTVYIISAFLPENGFPGADVCVPYELGDQQVVEAQAAGNLTEMFQPPFVLK
jgi:hypothetical protein